MNKEIDYELYEKLIERDTPFKPTPCSVTLGRCKCGVGFLDRSTNFCGNCGQRLDWSDRDNGKG